MEKLEKEVNILIASRVLGKGDTWKLVGEDIERLSLTDALEAYFQKTQDKCHFRLEPLNSKLFAIKTQIEDIVSTPPKQYNIYGDFL
jgi:signal recognition particle GTPase